MKRLLAVFLILIFLLPLAATAPFPRHVDPATASDESPYGPDLLQFYGLIFGAFSQQNYSRVSSLLKQTSLIHVPQSISFVINRFDSLINSTRDLLQIARYDINNASFFVGVGKIKDASTYLGLAVSKLEQANSTVDELEAAALTVVQLTGGAQNIFISKVRALRAILNQYWAEIPPLRQKIVGSQRLVETAIILRVNATSIRPGSDLAVKGVLKPKSGLPLASRYITFFFQNSNISITRTTLNGSFAARFATPALYVRNVSVFASFVPKGNDTLYYGANSSSPVFIELVFESPVLRSSVPRTAYPGLPVLFSGDLSNGGRPVSGFKVSITAFGSTTQVATSEAGTFSGRVVVPGGIANGSSTVSFQTAGNGTLAPATADYSINVVRIAPVDELNVPALAFVGFPSIASGSIAANGSALQDAKILHIGADITVNATSDKNGAFQFSMVPALTLPTGYWTFRLGIYPKENWIQSRILLVKVLVINPLTLLGPGSGIFLVGLLLLKRRRGQAVVLEQREPQVSEAAAWEISYLERPALLGIYLKALDIISKVADVQPLPNDTLREYFERVKWVEGAAPFERITELLEEALYGQGYGSVGEIEASLELAFLKAEVNAV
jgi:hypothetical protein